MGVKRILMALCPTALRPYADRIESSPIGSRIAHGAFWSLAGAFFSRGLTFVATIIVARIFGKSVFGQLGIIQSTMGVFQVFAGFGLGVTATKYVAEFKRSDPAKAGRIMALSGLVAAGTGAVMAVAMWVSAPWLAEHMLAAPQLAGPLKISSWMLFFSALSGAQSGAIVGFEAFKAQAWVNLATGVISFPLMVGGAYWFGLTGAVWGLVLPMGATWFLNHLLLRKEAGLAGVPFLVRGCWQQHHVLGQFALPAVFAGIVSAPIYWACGALLVNRPGGYAEMGVFNAANQWFTLLLLLPGILSQPLFPILSERLGLGDRQIAAKVLKAFILLNGLITIPIAIAISAVSPWVMGLYGPGYSSSWLVLIVVVATAALLSLQSPVGQVIAAAGRMWMGFFMNLGWAIVFLGCTWLFLSGGALGLAGARGLAYIVHSSWTFAFAYYILSRSGKWGRSC